MRMRWLAFVLALSAQGAGDTPMNDHVHTERAVVRTFPDGYRDDGVGSVYADAMSIISFYLWHEEGQSSFTARDLEIALQLPEAVAVHSVAVYRSRRPNTAIASTSDRDGQLLWTLRAGNVTLEEAYRLYAHYPLVPWTMACVHVTLKPVANRSVPPEFDVPWHVRAGGMQPASGTMKLASFPVRPVPALKRFKVWSTLGMYTATYDEEFYTATLSLYRRLGVNGLLEAGGCGVPALLSHEQLQAMGFETIKLGRARRTLATQPAQLEEETGTTLSDDDLAVNLDGGWTRDKTSTTSVHSTCRNYYCLTRMLAPASPVFGHMLGLFEENAAKGFRYFFSDYEHIAFAECYCPSCRRGFAEATGLPLTTCLELKPRELAEQHTTAWYMYRTAQMGKVLQAVAKELRKTYPDAQVGFNDNFHHESYFFPAFDSYGCASWAEDPRTLDPYLDFHSADVLGTGLSSIYCLDLYCQRNSSGVRLTTKPVIPRVSSFIWVNWAFHCVFGRMDRARSDARFDGLGMDVRPPLQKLEIAHAAAIGAWGIEVDLTLYSCDARTADGVSRGLAYVAEFEDILDLENRQDWRAAEVCDRTPEASPYHEIGPKGLSGRFLYGYARNFGFVQFVHHRLDERFTTSIFNWDFYQGKELTVRFPQIPPGTYCVSLYRDGARFHCTNGTHQTWSAEQLQRGIALEVPAGGICVVDIGPRLRPGYTVPVAAASPAEPGQALTLYGWRRPPSEGDMQVFKAAAHDAFMERMKKR